MTTNITSMLQFWKEFNLSQLQRDLDVSAAELAGRQDASDVSRRKLVEQSKEFKKATPEDVRKSVAPLLRSFQSEVDALSKRSKASESDFLNLYKKLIELPDPIKALEQAEQYQKRAQKLNDVETENQKLRETLAEYNKEFAEVKNQEVTIKSLREKVREYEKGKEDLAKQLTLEKSEQLQKEFVEKEKKMQETQLLIATKLGEAEQMAVTYKAALESSQSELFDLKSKYDEEIAAKQAELDLVMGDLERMTQRSAISEKEIERLKETLSASLQSEVTKTPAAVMEESFEALSRSSLEAELANKEKEISQLIEDVQHLQGSMGKLRESSATAIAKLEDELTAKNDHCQELQNRIDERGNYDEIKRELEIMKSTEFASFDSSENVLSPVGTSKGKSLELLLMEKNRAQQSENTTLRAANAQLTESSQRGSAASSSSSREVYDEIKQDRKERASTSSERMRRSSSTSLRNPLSPPDLIPRTSIGCADTLSQLQIQNQRQLNALLNLKILASLKAAVASQNISSTPLLSSFINFQPIPSPKPFYLNNFKDTASQSAHAHPPRIPYPLSNSAETSPTCNTANSNMSFPTHARRDRSPRIDYCESSSDDETVGYSSDLFTSWFGGLRRPSDPIVSSVTEQERYRSEFARFRSLSHTGDSTKESIDTDELTGQVKAVLQANNIGQRAFGQHVLGLSQGSVSEILSKPKPWSKLTLKGKEPFYKMMDFLSSPDNVDSLKRLQRRDRQEKVACGTRTQTIHSSLDARSDRTISKILDAAQEEMRTQQERLSQTQKIISNEIGVSEGKYSFSKQKYHSKPIEDPDYSQEVMAAVASGHCTVNIPHMSQKLNPNSTSGAIEPAVMATLNASLPSSIMSRQSHASGNVNGRLLMQSCIRDKESQGTPEQSGKSVDGSPKDSNKRLDNTSIDCLGGNVACEEKKESNSLDPGSLSIKSEPPEFTSIENYFTKVNGQLRFSSQGAVNSRKGKNVTGQCQVYNESNQSKRLNSSQNDPFIHPPLSPAIEDAQSNCRSNSACSPTFDGGGSTRFNSENSINSPRAGSEKSPSNSTDLLQAPALFKELTHFDVSDSDSEHTTKVVTTCTTFSGMLSSGMSSLQTTSSMFDDHASYTELNPVTSGSLYNSNRNSHELASISSAFSNVESGQNGISSMLAPLVTSGLQQQAENSAHTYSTLTSTSIGDPQSGDNEYLNDHAMEASSLSSPISPDALQKLSMTDIDTELLTKQVRDRLIRQGICQRVFGERILGLSQGTVSDILSHPKPWSKLTHKGREPFARMILWLADNAAGGLLQPHEGISTVEVDNMSRSSSTSPSSFPVNLSKGLVSGHPAANSMEQYATLSSPSSAAHSPQSSKSHECLSPVGNLQSTLIPVGMEAPPVQELSHPHYKSNAPNSSGHGTPMTPLQQMINIQELAANCPKLDTYQVTKTVKQMLTEHNIGQRIFGQAVLGLTQGSVSDLLSRPKDWKTLSLKGREPFVRMQLWLSDPHNIEQLKNLKLERWMEKKWVGKRQRCDGGIHALSPVKKQRIVLSAEEKDVLRCAYNIEPYPSQETVDLLAVKLGRKSSTIVNWFHNYRSRVKRGFFPGEQPRDAVSAGGGNKKQGGSKMTVKQLLDEITLSSHQSGSSCSQSRSVNLNFQRSFKNGNGNLLTSTGSAHRVNSRDSAKISTTVSWVRSDNNQSPTDFDHCAQGGYLKTDLSDSHFQNLRASVANDVYPNSAMHIKEELKMVQLQSADAMFCPPYSYPSTTSLDVFKPHENSLNDPVAVAAASSYIQPKAVHETSHYSSPPGQLFTNLDNPSHRHEDYAPDLPAESSFTPITASNIPTSPSSPQPNSILPSVYTLTPKKTTYAQSNTGLPAASSLLNPSITAMNNMSMETAMSLSTSQVVGHSHRFMNMNRPRYDMVLTGNNNMNNNSHAEMLKNTTFPSEVQIGVSSPMPSPIHSNSSIVTGYSHSVTTTSVPGCENLITSRRVKTEACQLTNMDNTTYPSNPDKDNADDAYSWVF